MDNTITLSGTMVADCDLRFTTSGRAVASARIAVNRRYQSNGEWTEEVSFVPLVLWGELGENAAASLMKGTRVIASGRIQQREYETREGEKRSVMEMVVDDIGASVKWANVQVERITRDKPADRPASGSSGNSGGGGVVDLGDEQPFVAPATEWDL